MNNKIIEFNYDGEILNLEFKKPSKLVFAAMLQQINKQDYYSAIEILIKNCYIKTKGFDLLNDEIAKIKISGDLISEFIKFKTVNIETSYKGKKLKKDYESLLNQYPYVFCVTVGNEDEEQKTFFLKPLSKNDYKQIFNFLINNPLKALDYVWSNLKVGGDDVISDDDYYISCMNISEYLLSYKQNEVKKN